MQVKILACRSLKDKIASGHFIVRCSVLDRLGGDRFEFDLKDTEKSLRKLSIEMRDYNKAKREFINQEEKVKLLQEKPEENSNPLKLPIHSDLEKQSLDLGSHLSSEINHDLDIPLELNQRHTHFTRYNGLISDDALMIEDNITLLLPS